ncbi:hypothetical protein BAUCODRAFT_93813 [Baudoinia panamericana UAMH 10762]|uniref:Allantoin permease n=1 Tax=Baudoinia panamericana (strain UAMH 10762) TaxID=717646 RepID=M2N543_BAUPA|nr:uncharacterized protein BAUCODRAFT_93813 [Baudoinia panamericana UAMH 10762]EMC93885.1 hypothetical protein BAUCODRAFT_93813 [Baudoinia panamericana UAMH 10762]
MPTMEGLKASFRSRDAFVEFLRAPQEAVGSEGMVGNSKWSNKDLEPTAVEQRTWSWYNLPLFWFTNMFGTTGWTAASSLIAVGLTWQQAFISCVLGSLISAIMVTLMARPGVMYHVGYPVICRSVMGMYGSFFFIFIRAVVCIIWYGIQTYYAANLLSVCFRCMFGSSWVHLANTLPVSAHVTTKQLLCFFLCWLIEFPFCFIHPTGIRHIFTVKGIIVPLATFGLFGWCMAHGTGLSTANDFSKKAAAAGNSLGWAVMTGINVIMGTLSPMLINQPDLARYCKRPRDAGWIQGACVLFTKTIVLFLGLASTASMAGKWGKAYWNIWDLLNAILDHHWNATARTGVWFVAASFMLAAFASNFGANSVPFGADCTGLFPRWMTIRRGQILCAVLGVAIVPWELLANATKFISFLGSYNIFMAPLCAVFIIHYAVGTKGNIHVPSLYDGSKTGLYRYWSGVNWISAFAWFGGVIMGIPGLVGTFQPKAVPKAAVHMYNMGWILTFATAAAIYWVALLIWKPRVFPAGFEDVPVTYEYLATPYGRDGFFDGERAATAVSPDSMSVVDVQVTGKEDSKAFGA